MKKLLGMFLVMFLSIILVACGENDTVENERKILEERRAEREQAKKEESLEKESSIEELMTPYEYAEEISSENYPVEFDDQTDTFHFIMPSEAKVEILNEDNLYYTNEEYEQFLIDTKADFVTMTEGVTKYSDESYSTVLALGSAEEVLLKIVDTDIVENNLDMRVSANNQYSEIDKEQYDKLGDYIYIDYRKYVDNLEKLVTDSYNNIITQDEFVDGLDRVHSELTYYCTTLLTKSEEGNDEILSDDISEMVGNAFLSCSTLQSTYFNFMMPYSDGIEASDKLEESIDYFSKAKEIYDNTNI